MEDRSTELDEREVIASRRRGGARRRPGRFPRALHASLLIGAFLSCPARTEERTPVTGRLVLKGKALAFDRAWLVRGPGTFDRSRPAAYLILSSQDVSAAIAACPDVQCVVWKVVKDGAILEASQDGDESFWLRVVSPELAREQQLSGRRFTPLIDRHDRLSGRLAFSYGNTGDEADLEIDAALLKEFPQSRP